MSSVLFFLTHSLVPEIFSRTDSEPDKQTADKQIRSSKYFATLPGWSKKRVKVPSLTTLYTNEECQRWGNWVWTTCPESSYAAAPWPGIELATSWSHARRPTIVPPRQDRIYNYGRSYSWRKVRQVHKCCLCWMFGGVTSLSRCKAIQVGNFSLPPKKF